MTIARKVASEKGVLKEGKISEGWRRRFKERNPHVVLRKGDPMATVRFDSTTQEVIDSYYELLGQILVLHDLKDKPGQIYNVDESGIPLDAKPLHVCAQRGTKKVRQRTSGKKSQITIVGCGNAAGAAIPPMVIFDAKFLNQEWTIGEIPGTIYGLSEHKGWIDTELFKDWLIKHFVKHASSARPLLLLLDGHSTHYQPEVVHFAHNHDIVMFCLPPHTTQDSQPLDTSVFGSLKQHMAEACHCYLDKHPGQVVTKYQFSRLFAEAWMKAVTPANMIAGFRKAGVYPFNPKAITVPEKIGKELGLDATSLVNESPHCTTEELTSAPTRSFTKDEVTLFQKRFEEKYNLFTDKNYVDWLGIYHPDALPATVLSSDDLSASSDKSSSSLAEVFSSVSPLEPLDFVSENVSSSGNATCPLSSLNSANCLPMPSSSTLSSAKGFSSSSSSADSLHSSNSLEQPLSKISQSLPTECSPCVPSAANSSLSLPQQPSLNSQQKAPLSSQMSSSVSVVSKFLVHPSPCSQATPTGKTMSKRIGGARVLTSAEGLAILQAQKEKKCKKRQRKKEERWKERRKGNRGKKPKQSGQRSE